MRKILRGIAGILIAVDVTMFSFTNISFAKDMYGVNDVQVQQNVQEQQTINTVQNEQEQQTINTVQSTQKQYAESGRTSISKPDMEELRQLYNSLPTYDKLYKTEPVVEGTDYHIAVLSDEAYDTAKGLINYYRRVAGLGDITLSDDVNESAAYGALALAMNNSGLTHYPSQPKDMSSIDYNKAYAATTSSNLSSASGYSEKRIISVAVSGQIGDSDSSNIDTLGHRRWLLNPGVKTLGIGSANNNYNYYTDIRVFGDGIQSESVNDYDFIAWPSSGANLTDTFPKDTPWSVTLNPKVYYTPTDVSVEVKSLRYGTTWYFDNNTGYGTSSIDNYFNIEKSGYGVANCIIFRPAYQYIDMFKGDYIVTVSNVRRKDTGEYTNIQYKVTFDNYDGTTSINDCDISLAKDSYEYEGQKVEPEVTVKDKELASIEWAKKPAASIIEGQELAVALKGAAIKVVYSDGTTDEISVTDQMCSGLNDTVGTQTITVTYGAKTLTFDIEVKAKSITGIEVTTKPAKTEYVEGTDLDVTGGVLTVSYDNGKTETVDMTSAMCSGYEKNPAAYREQTITVTYKEHTAVFTVKVRKKAMASIELVSIPAGTEVLEGKELDLTDAKIKVVYDNGTSKEAELTKDMLKDFDNTKVGEQTVTVSYSEDGVTKTTTFTATVKAKSVKSVELVSAPEKTEVLEGKDLDLTGAKIKVVYDNGTEDLGVNVTSDMISGFDKNTVGKQTITIKYNGYTVAQTFEVTVIEKVLEKIAITTKPSKTSIIEGTKLDVTDGVITLYYDNDTTATVAMTNDMISGFDNSKVGDQTVTVTYKGKTAELAVTVAAKTVTDVTLVSAPTATTVTEGLALDLTGGKIHVTYDNGTEEDMDITEGMLTLDTNVVGKQTATVTYGGKTVTFEVEVLAKAATGLALSFGEVTDLKEGTELADAGLEVYLVYNNGTKDTLKLTDVTIKGYDPAVLGKQDVKVSYKTADGAAYEIGFIVRVLKNSEIDSTVTGVSDEEYLVVSKETSVKKMKEVVEALSKVVEKYEKYEVLDIKLLSKLTGAETQPDGSLKITLDIPAGLNKANKLTVYRLVEGDGSMKKLDTSVEGDKITFATDHFSTYVIVEEKVETPTTQESEKDTTTAETPTVNNETQTTVKADETTAAGNTTAQETTTAKGTSVKTGDAKNVAAVLGMIVAAGAGFVVFSRRKVQR